MLAQINANRNNNERVQPGNTGGKMTTPKAPDSVASSPKSAAGQNITAAKEDMLSPEAARVNIRQVNNDKSDPANSVAARTNTNSNKAEQAQNFPNTPKGVNINKTAQHIASANKQAQNASMATVALRANGGRHTTVSQNAMDTANVARGQAQAANVSARASVAPQAINARAETPGNIAVNGSNSSIAAAGGERGASSNGIGVHTAQSAVNTANMASNSSAPTSSAVLGSTGREFTAQIMRVIQHSTADSGAAGKTSVSQTNVGSVSTTATAQILTAQTMFKPIQINLAFVQAGLTNPAVLTGMNGEKLVINGQQNFAAGAVKEARAGGLIFGDIGVKETKAQSQPIISFAELSRIAHERDIQKENLSKLINLLFGKIMHKEEDDEDLEGMYGIWRDYLDRQREQKDQREKEERRKKKQKQEAELQEEELAAVMPV
jgi:hypothetical protein